LKWHLSSSLDGADSDQEAANQEEKVKEQDEIYRTELYRTRGRVTIKTMLSRSVAVRRLGLRSLSGQTVVSSTHKEEKPKSVLEEYGLLPLVGFGTAIAFSKELVVINDEILLGGLILSTTFGLFVTLKEPVVNRFTNLRNEIER